MLLFEKNTTLSEQVQKNTTVGTGKKKTTLSEQVQSRIEKIVERGKIDNPNTQIHDHSLSQLGTDTPIKSGGVNLVYKDLILHLCFDEDFLDCL